MRYTQGEKLEIIRLVEGSDLPIRTTLSRLGVSRASFYRWYRAYVEHGVDGLAPKPPTRWQFWNRIPDSERERVVEIALEKPELSARELAFWISDNKGFFISESSVYRILKAYDLVTSPAYIVMSAADEFKHKTRRVHELVLTPLELLDRLAHLVTPPQAEINFDQTAGADDWTEMDQTVGATGGTWDRITKPATISLKDRNRKRRRAGSVCYGLEMHRRGGIQGFDSLAQSAL